MTLLTLGHLKNIDIEGVYLQELLSRHLISFLVKVHAKEFAHAQRAT